MKSKMFIVTPLLQGPAREWYETERNTAALIKAVCNSRQMCTLSGDDLWNILRLTWITASGGEAVEDNWRRLKVPALAALFKRTPVPLGDLDSTIKRMGLPPQVAKTAVRTTGIVNFRNVWRNSSRSWCGASRELLIGILRDAGHLPSNDSARFKLAARIDALPAISSPTGGVHAGAAAAMTPVVACLDPSSHFPIINGRDGVRYLLRKLRLQDGDLARQVAGLTNLIGQFAIPDAFAIDCLADEIAEQAPVSLPAGDNAPTPDEGAELPYLDQAERVATTKSQTITYRKRHNRMTDRIKDLFSNYVLKQGNHSDYRYDVLIKNYDDNGRDLLIEAKPDPDRGGIRIAIGQLLDYRRHLPNRLGTDLAIVTISRPPRSHIDFLLDLQISVLWFSGESCGDLDGNGKVWPAIRTALTGTAIHRAV
jgi:hypothetical protein